MNRVDDVAHPTGFDEPVDVEVDRRLWNLEVRPTVVDATAAVWRECAGFCAVDADDAPSGLRDDVLPRSHRMSALASQIAKELELAASQLRQRQEWLDEMLIDLMAAVPADDRRLGSRHPGPTAVSRSTHDVDFPSHVVFRASSFQDLRVIEETKANAKRVRQRAAETVDGVRWSLEAVTRQFQQLSAGVTTR